MSTKSKTSARRSGSRKSKSVVRQAVKAIKSAWPRHSALSETARIVLPKENPFREGTDRFKGFEAARKAKTVGKFLSDDFAKGKEGTPRNFRRALLRNLVHEKVAKVA